ncbi:MAG: peptidylprolyl isomerase [Gammaproteobacteria bacterium]|nr:peptidylprolyl isomerase [Gammaproteobacteria bacterium]
MKQLINTTHRILILAALLVLLLPSQGFSAQRQALDRIVAVVNDDVITALELNTELQSIKQQLRSQRMSLPPDDVLQKQVLERMIVLNIQLQDADRRHIRVDDEAINNTVENIARQNNMTIMQFSQALRSDGLDYSEFRKRIGDELTINRLQQREVANRVTVTEQEVEDFLASQESQSAPSDEYHIAHILVSIPEAATAERIQSAKQKAQKILDDLNQGTDFAQLAVAQSDGQQALEGGDLGWRTQAQIPSLIAATIANMQVGQYSDAIRSPSGFHIFKLMDKRSNEVQHIVNQTKVRHILIKPDLILSSSEARKRIEQLKQRIEGGEDFAQLATTHSDDKGSATQGGDLGWVNPGVMVQPFEEAMNALPIGQVSDPVQTRFGWHILQVLDRRKFDDTEEYKRNQAREVVRQRKIEPAMANWLRRIRDEAFVEVRL